MPIALALSLLYLIWAPASADLAAQTFRADLFSERGFAVWSNAWYGGFHLPGYSLLFPALGSLLGIRLVAALSVIAASAAFSSLARRHYGDRARWACMLFGLGAATNLFTGRFTFALGVALGLGALLALDRRRPLGAAVLAALAAAASPVAGLFLALAGAALWLRGARRAGVLLAVPGLGVVAVLSLGFPTSGTEPFVFSSFWWVPASVILALLVLPRRARALRVGAALYLLMGVGLFVFDTPVGGNATRLATVFGPALMSLGLLERRRPWLVAVAIAPVLYWSVQAPIRDVRNAEGDPSVTASYYRPLLGELASVAPVAPFRVEVPPTRERWEAVHVGERYPLARGWLRQLEAPDFDLFQNGKLTAASYRTWLDQRAVAFVAIPDAHPDYLSEDEIDLVHGGLPYLREVFSSAHWELYAVRDPLPLADPPARIDALGAGSFTLSAQVPGDYRVRVSPSRWWRVSSGPGCVAGEREGDLLVRLDRPGEVEVTAGLSLAGITGGHGRC